MGSPRKDLKAFPSEVKDVIGYALYQAQVGQKTSARPPAGFGGASVLELIEDFRADTYRAVYTVKFSDLVYVLHAFQKKSKKGVATPKTDIDLIKGRLRLEEEDYNTRSRRRT